MEKQPQKTTTRDYYLFAIRTIGDFGATIAVPVVIFVLIGQYLDGKYDKGPIFTISAFILAALVSGKIIYKKSKIYGRDYQTLVDNENINKNEKEKNQL